MNSVEEELEAAEKEWTVPDVTREESPETAMAVKAHNCFVDKIMLASAIKKRRTELGLDGELTREKLDGIRTINGLCRKANGDIDRIAEALKEDALKWQKAVNVRKGELKTEIAAIQVPMVAFIKKCEAEDEEAQREAEEAERKAAQAIEDAKRAAEAEANRKERERLAKEREAIEDERRNADRAAQIERCRIAAEAAETARILAESVRAAEVSAKAERDKLDAERRAFYATKAAAEKTERDRLTKIAAEQAAAAAEAQRIELAKAEEFHRQQAAECERLRLETLEPDIHKIRRIAAAINNLLAVPAPVVESEDAKATVARVITDLKSIVSYLLKFGTN